MKKNTNTDQAKTHQSLTMVYTPNFYHMQSLFLSLLDHCSFSCGQSYNGLEFEIVNEHTRCPGYFFLHAVDMNAVSLVTSRENSKYFQSFPLCRGRPARWMQYKYSRAVQRHNLLHVFSSFDVPCKIKQKGKTFKPGQ